MGICKHHFFRCGLNDVWRKQKIDCKGCFVSMVKSRLHESYERQGRMDMNSSTDGRLYRFIKEEFKFEKNLREAIPRVTLISHLFQIERGRWKRPKVERENRLCDVCHEVCSMMYVLKLRSTAQKAKKFEATAPRQSHWSRLAGLNLLHNGK